MGEGLMPATIKQLRNRTGYDSWREWYDGLGDWAAWGPRNPQVRPNVPRSITLQRPHWWLWRREWWKSQKPPPYSGFFASNGVFLRGPGGESEDVAAMQAAGFTWVAGNIGDHHPDSWAKIRLRCSAYNVAFLPWLRCKPEGADAADAVERTRKVARTAQQWGSRALIVNLEDEAWTDFPPANVASLLQQENWRGEVGCSTVGYPPTSPDWKLLGVGLMQAFMNENPRLLPADCVKRGLECGFHAAYPTFGTYPAKHPWTAASYQQLWSGPYSVYVGDEVGAARAWKEWA